MLWGKRVPEPCSSSWKEKYRGRSSVIFTTAPYSRDSYATTFQQILFLLGSCLLPTSLTHVSQRTSTGGYHAWHGRPEQKKVSTQRKCFIDAITKEHNSDLNYKVDQSTAQSTNSAKTLARLRDAQRNNFSRKQRKIEELQIKAKKEVK